MGVAPSNTVNKQRKIIENSAFYKQPVNDEGVYEADVVGSTPDVYTGEEEASEPFSMGNYIGPYWSDGKIQTSVEFGEAEARSKLDELARLHDTAYAHYGDREHREAADLLFAAEAKKLVGKFPHLAAAAVSYGNYTGRQGKKLLSYVTQPHPVLSALGLIKFAYENVRDSTQRIDGTYLKKEKQDVLNLYSRDPKRNVSVPKAETLGVDAGYMGKTMLTSSRSKSKNGGGPTIKDLPAEKPPLAGSSEKVNSSPTRFDILVARQAQRMMNYNNKKKAAMNSVVPASESIKFVGYEPEFYKRRMRKLHSKKRKNQVQPGN